MGKFDLEKSKEWYYDAVESCLILRGKTRKEAQELLANYQLKERLEQFPYVQLHYDVEAIAEEVVELAKK